MPSYTGLHNEAPLTYKTAATVTKANIKATGGVVVGIHVTNANAAVRYFQLHNKATAPVGTDTAQIFWAVPANGQILIGADYLNICEPFATGIGWAISTTAAAFTDSATAGEHAVVVRYV